MGYEYQSEELLSIEEEERGFCGCLLICIVFFVFVFLIVNSSGKKDQYIPFENPDRVLSIAKAKSAKIRQKGLLSQYKFDYSITCFSDDGKLLVVYNDVYIIEKKPDSVEWMNKQGKKLFYNGRYILSQDY